MRKKDRGEGKEEEIIVRVERKEEERGGDKEKEISAKSQIYIVKSLVRRSLLAEFWGRGGRYI